MTSKALGDISIAEPAKSTPNDRPGIKPPSRSKRDITPTPPTKVRKGLPLGPPPANACVGKWCGTQIGHAAIIVDEGRRAGLPERAWVIAVATAMQESALHNQATDVYPITRKYPHDRVGADHDSVGLFQQRPQSGWGTPEELMDPRTTAAKFYASLKKVINKRPNWEKEPLTDIAQAVQRSAFPDHYQKHEADAQRIVDLVLRYPYTGKKGTERSGDFVMFQCENLRHDTCRLMRVKLVQPIIDNKKAFKELFPRAPYSGDVGDKAHQDAQIPEDHTPDGKGNSRPGWIYAQDLGEGKGFDLPDFVNWLMRELKAGKYPEIKYVICTHPNLKGSGNYGSMSRRNGWRATHNSNHNHHVHISYREGYELTRSTIIADYYRYKNGG